MSKIKASQLWEEVKKIAAEKPNYIYESPHGTDCVYLNNHEPSCIVGHGFVRCGLSTYVIAEFEKLGVRLVFERFPEYVEADDPQAVKNLESAQDSQDVGENWGKSVDVDGEDE